MLKNILQSLLSRGTVAVINFLILLISSRYLGVSSRGEISILLLGISIMQALSGIYAGQSIVHFVPSSSLPKLTAGALVFTLTASAVCNVALVILNKQVPGYEWKSFIVAVLVIINTFHCMVILGCGDIKKFNMFSILQPLLLLAGIAFYIFVKKIYTFEAYFYPLVFSFIATLSLTSITVVSYFFEQHRGHDFRIGKILGGGLQYQASLILLLYCTRYYYYLLPGTANLGLYASAVTLTESVLIIANGLAPMILSHSANEDKEMRGAETVLFFCKAIFLLTLAGLALLCFIPDDAFVFLLGSGFRGMHSIIVVYAPAVLLLSLVIPLTAYFSGIGRQKTILRAHVFGALITTILSPVLIKAYGTSGAAVSALCSFLVIVILLLFSFIRYNSVPFFSLFSLKSEFSKLKKLLIAS